MKELTTVLCYGCSADTIAHLEEALPSSAFNVAQTNCATDLIALPCLVAVLSPESLTEENQAMLIQYYSEIPEEAPVLTSPSAEFDEAGIRYRLLPEHTQDMSYILLQQIRTQKKSVHFYNSIVDALRILKEIKLHPCTTTRELASVIERNERTALRYIHSLSVAGELIAYDQEKHGWYLMNGYSSLIEDAVMCQPSEGMRLTTPSAEISFISSMQENSWDWDIWYRQSLSAFRDVISTGEDDTALLFIWYCIAETLQSITAEPSQCAVCCDIIGDMMRRLRGSNDRCNEIMRDVLQNSELYAQLMGRYRLSMNPREMGSFWKEWGAQHTSRECADMVEKLLPFWCWHKEYTLRFAECWCEEFGESDKIDTSKYDFGFDEDCLLEVAESMQTHRRTPLQVLLTTYPLAVWSDAVPMDAEDVLLLFLRSKLGTKQSFRLAYRVVHAMQLTQEDVKSIRQSGIPTITADALLSQIYIPSRRRAAARMLQTMVLKINE